MAHFKIEGLHPYDGEYPFNVDTLTNRELHTIKQLAGVRANEIEEAAEAGDNDLIVAFAIIALQRAGLKVDPDAIWEADVGKITFQSEEADPLPPPNALDVSANGSDESEPSGEDSPPDS